jgi:putative membrane protein
MKARLSSPEAKQEVKQAIQAVEAQTAAELVVAVRPQVGHYRHVDYLVGFISSFAALLVFLFYPLDFEINTMPFESLLAFVLGAVVSAHAPPLRRLLVSRKVNDRAVRNAACAAFVDLGVSKTSGRTGILVLVAVYERRVEVVADVGVPTAQLGTGWSDANAELAKAVRRSDLTGFVAALRSLGPVLGKVLPRAVDDVNELPDEVA